MTNGLVSMTQDGQVLLKVVCGCDGYNAVKMAYLLRLETEVPPVDVVRRFAEAVGFGCDDCLVIQTPDADDFRGEDELGPLYREKFNDPSFNPRWECGDCAETEIVEL